MKSKNKLDEAFLPFAEFIEASADVEGVVADPGGGVAMHVEHAEIHMPVEIDLAVDDDGRVSLGAVPPLYYVETTIMPVFHHITLVLEAVEDTSYGK